MFLEKIVCGVFLFLLLSCNELGLNNDEIKKCKSECDVNSLLLYQFGSTFNCPTESIPNPSGSSQTSSFNRTQYEFCLSSNRNRVSQFITRYNSDCKKKCE
jgi:hypothetical protein